MPSIFIWDHSGAPPAELAQDARVVFWRSYSTHGVADAVSIPQWVEDHATDLRARYLAWVYECGATLHNGVSVVEHLQWRPGFSAWWMTLIAEKCNFAKSPQIDTAIKLLAFSDWLAAHDVRGLAVATLNKQLQRCLCDWAQKNGLPYKQHGNLPWREARIGWMDLVSLLPHKAQAFLWLGRHLWTRWPLRGVGLNVWRKSQGKRTFISYMFNLEPKAAGAGTFESRYWGKLPATLREGAVPSNWLHIYIPDSILPNARTAARQIAAFNQKSRIETHITLDAFLSLKTIVSAVADWHYLVRASRRIKKAEMLPSLGRFDVWPLFASDWDCSLRGKTAMGNALTLNLFEAAFSSVGQQEVGVYLQENMDWEFAAIHSWRSAGHQRLIGFPHSSLRFWDLRYFCDPRSLNPPHGFALPRPDTVAVHGQSTRDAYVASYYPATELADVEALRYLYLNDMRRWACDIDTNTKPKQPASKNRLRLLVLGEYNRVNTTAMMAALLICHDNITADVVITVKPHPACPVDPRDYPGLNLTVTTRTIVELVQENDVSLSSVVTTAALDAFCLGIPVITYLDPQTLNMSPLRGYKDAIFVETADELAIAIGNAADQPRAQGRTTDFFNLSGKLTGWKQILDIPV